jgi:chemotaxis protein CheX
VTARVSSIPNAGNISWQIALEDCAREVFQIMLGSSFHAENEPVPAVFSVSAVVGFAGQLRGLLTLRCSRASALSVAARMLGIQPALAEPEMNDALGELSNMVAGSFKTKLERDGFQCMISVPTVVSGSDYQLHNLADGSMTQVCGRFDGGTIEISLQLQH